MFLGFHLGNKLPRIPTLTLKLCEDKAFEEGAKSLKSTEKKIVFNQMHEPLFLMVLTEQKMMYINAKTVYSLFRLDV